MQTETPAQPSASIEPTQPSQEEDADVEMEDSETNQEEIEANTAEEASAETSASTEQEDEDDEEDDHEDQSYETITSRFVERLLKYLFQGFSDARASVRVRCCQIIALCISSMGELE